MSDAEEESDIDLQHEPQSDSLQDAQLDPYQNDALEEELAPFPSSDEFIPEDEAGPSTKSRSKTIARRQHDAARIVPEIANHPFAEEPSYFTRLNRYFGPDSTWLSWTREERLVAETLDQLRSQDLSIHLFNAYALRRTGVTTTMSRNDKGKGKARAASKDEDVDTDAEAGGVFPPRAWTAWPLPPQQVPRDVDKFDRDKYTFRSEEDLRPSAELEESLISTALRFARERWNSRSWEPEFASQRDMKVEHDSDVEMTQAAERTIEDPPTTLEETDAAETFSTDSSSGSEVFVSQRWNMAEEPILSAPKAATEEGPSSTTPDRRPTPIADDDIARDLLLPGTRHILSKLDDLLMALHTARHTYAVKHDRKKHSKSERLDTSEDSDSAASRTRYRKRKRSASIASHHSEDPSKPAAHKPQHSQLNPRDWSDVIGMAALTGWSPAVIQRASARCASLFNSNMLFRTFPPTSSNQGPAYTTHQALSPSNSPCPQSSSLNPKKKASITTTSIRTSRACTTCSTHKVRCLPSTLAPGTGPCQRCIASGVAHSCSGITTKATRVSETRCPHPSCDRHYTPFKKSSHLQRHLDSVHLNSPAPGSSPLPSSSEPSGADLPSSRTIVCPVPSCPRHEPERGFNRGARLYKHISAMHPEVDVEAVKRLESMRRGERRGRWRREERRGIVGWENRRRGVSRPVGGRGGMKQRGEAEDNEEQEEGQKEGGNGGGEGWTGEERDQSDHGDDEGEGENEDGEM